MNTLGKTILITGASRGIGRAIATSCAPYFDTMLLTCKKSETELLSLKEELENAHRITCIPFIGDMGDPAFVSSIFERVSRQVILSFMLSRSTKRLSLDIYIYEFKFYLSIVYKINFGL